MSQVCKTEVTQWLCLEGDIPGCHLPTTRTTGRPSLKPLGQQHLPTPCHGVVPPYLPPPRCPQGQCLGRGSAAPHCGRRGSPSPSRARTPSRLRWRSRHFSPASRGKAELLVLGLLVPVGSFPTHYKDGSAQTPALTLVSISAVDGASAASSSAAPKRSFGLIFSFLVWEAAPPTQMYFSSFSNLT